jgi:hypothetical protein
LCEAATPTDIAAIDYGSGVLELYNTNGITKLTPTRTSTSTTTGRLVVDGGAGISENLNIGGVIAVTDATDSSSTTTGSIHTAGGLGVAKRVTATNMTCSTAPSVATDVVRLSDISGYLSSSTSTYTTAWDFMTGSDLTIYLYKVGRQVMCYWMPGVTPYTVTESMITYVDTTTSMGYPISPYLSQTIPLLIWYNSTTKFVTVHISTGFTINATGGCSYFTTGDTIELYTQHFAWVSTS